MDDQVDFTTRAAPQSNPAATHPLELLIAAEILDVVRAVRADAQFGHRYRFETIELSEPAKEAVRAWQPVSSALRKASCGGSSSRCPGAASSVDAPFRAPGR